MKEALKILAIIAVICIAAFWFYTHIENNRSEVQQQLKDQKDLIMKQDSIREIKIGAALDSLELIKQRFETDKLNWRNENIKLRKQNEKLEKLYHSIDVSDRPDF